MRSRSQVVRRSAAVVAGIALAAGGVGVAGALQANATPDTTRITSTADVAAKPSISIKASKTTVKAWAKVSFTGKTSGIAANSVVRVQRLQSGRVGVNKFRVVTAKAASPAVSVSVTK